MKFLLVLCIVAAVARISAALPSRDFDEDLLDDVYESEGEIDLLGPEDTDLEFSARFLASWQVRRMIRKLQEQMPHGFPEYDIPPLAPFHVDAAKFELIKGILNSNNHVSNFSIHGLNDFVMHKLKVNLITSRVKFDFLFTNISVTSDYYVTDTLISSMENYGFSLNYHGNGTINFNLKNLRIAGKLYYSLPVVFGSAKITSLQTKISLEECYSDIHGIAGIDKLNELFNRQLESVLVEFINTKQKLVSSMIETYMVPMVNEGLVGTRLWTLISSLLWGGGKPGGVTQEPATEEPATETDLEVDSMKSYSKVQFIL